MLDTKLNNLKLPNINFVDPDIAIQQWQADSNKKSAVGVLFIPNIQTGSAELVFTKRTIHVSTHKGQIGFAGGKFESGENYPLVTAQREMQEEIAINTESSKFQGYLEPLPALDGHIVYPVVLTADLKIENLKANDSEVAEIFSIDWQLLQRTNAIDFKFNYLGIWRNSLSFQINNYNIWGLTAKIIYQANFHI